MMKYKYVAIEGVIGAGKTMLAQMLSFDFAAKVILEDFEDNDFLPKFYDNSDKYAFPLELSFMASRYQQLKNNVVTDIFQPLIISDYFFDKSLIFASKTLNEIEFKLFAKLFFIVNQIVAVPDLIIFLYSELERLKFNIEKRGRYYEQNIDIDYLKKINDGYFEYFKQIKNTRIVIKDITKMDFVANKNDYLQIKNILKNDYSLGINII